MFQIKVQCDDHTYRLLDAQCFAQSAADNDIDPVSFEYSLNNFCEYSTSSKSSISAWREEAISCYFDLLIKAGKVKLKPVEFQGGSDFDDSETALGDINTNKK